MKLRIGKKRVFIRFFISYIAILLIPIIIGSAIYVQVIHVVEKETEEKNSLILEQSRNIVDGYMASVDKIFHQLAFDSRVTQLLQVENGMDGIDIYRSFMAQRDFSVLNVTNDFIANFYIYFKDSNIIITKDTTYWSPELFYRNYFEAGAEGYEAWLDRIRNEYLTQEYAADTFFETNDRKKTVITSLQSIPVTSRGYSRGCIAILIDESKIRNLLDPISTDKGGWFYVVDAKGNILSSTDGKKGQLQDLKMNLIGSAGTKSMEINNQKMLATYVVSPKNNWKYVSVMPFSVVMQKAEHVKRVTISITLMILFSGIIIALMAAYLNDKPIKRMLKTLSGKLEVDLDLASKNEFDILERNLVSLIDNNEHLKQAMQEQVVLIKATFFERLIRGQFRGLEELDAIASLSGIRIRGSRHVVIMMQFIEFTDMLDAEYLDELERKRVFAKSVIGSCVQEQGFVHDIENDKIMLLYSFEGIPDSDTEKYVLELIGRVNSELYNVLKSRFAFGVGNACSNLTDVYKSYNEALHALDYRLKVMDDNIFLYHQIPQVDNEFYFPLEVQMRLFYLVKTGEREAVEKLFDEIYRENHINRQLSEEMAKLLINDLYATYVRIKSKLKMKEEAGEKVQELKSLSFDRKNSKQWYRELCESYCKLCEIVTHQKKNYNNQLVDEVTQFIHGNYMDPQLSLCSVASRFGLTEANLSYYFKERTGENFSAYIENIRIEEACKLLEKGDVPINEIAEAVGYNSAHSFRRAFKRAKAISPTDFKREVLESQ